MRKNNFGTKVRNKVVGALCSVVLAAGLCPVVALATDGTETLSYDADSVYSATLQQESQAVIGSTFDVSLTTATSDAINNPISCMQVTVEYNPKSVTLGEENIKIDDSLEMGAFADDGKGVARISFFGNTATSVKAATLTFTGIKAGNPGIKIADATAGSAGQLEDKAVKYNKDDLNMRVLFKDVTDSSKFYFGNVYAAVDKGIISGYKDGNFGPADTLTRAQAAVILWGIYGKPSYGTTNTTGMADVKDNAFYTAAANWAVDKGVINGSKTSSGLLFNPDGKITRQDLCVMVSNAAYKLNGTSIGGADRTKLNSMSDADSVSSYAANAVAWSLNNGVINGKGSFVAPKDDVTRGEMVTIAMNAIRKGLVG